MSGSYSPGLTYIVDTVDAHLLKLRVGQEPPGEGVNLGAVIESPEGRIIGWPGDIRFQTEPATIWQKASGYGTPYGWVAIGSSNFGPAIATLQAQVAQLMLDVGALQLEDVNLQNQITTINADIVTINNDIATLQGDVATLQGDVVTLQGDVVTLSDTVEVDSGRQPATVIDFRTFGTVAIVNGNNVIGGRNWIGANVALASVFNLTAANGFRFVNGVSVGSFDYTSGTQTSPLFAITAADLIADYDPSQAWAFEIMFTTSVLETGARWQLGLFGPAGGPTGSGARFASVGRQNNAGTVRLIGMQGAVVVGLQAVAGGPTEPDCYGIVCDRMGRFTFTAGVSSGGNFPAVMEPIGVTDPAITNNRPFMRSDMQIGFSFQSTNDASPTDELRAVLLRARRASA